MKTYFSHIMAHLALSSVKLRVRRGGYLSETLVSVGTGMLGIASINVTALTLCRKKQSEVFGKWPCINFHMGLKPYDAKCQ